MSNNIGPYKAVVVMSVSVHEVLKTGECSPTVMPPEEMEKYGFKTNNISVVVHGKNKFDCVRNLVHKIKEFHDGD